jgi:hypothetical protein
VNHLGEVTGTDPSGVDEPATLGAKRLKGRLNLGNVDGIAAHHQRVAVLKTPHTTTDSGIDVADALLSGQRRVDLVVGPTRVSAVDDNVVRIQEINQ